MKDLARKFNTSCQTFPDAAPEDAELLRNFSLICMLGYDVYVKKDHHRASDRHDHIGQVQDGKTKKKATGTGKSSRSPVALFICLYYLSVFCMRLNTMS